MKLFNYDIPDDLPVYQKDELTKQKLMEGLNDGTLEFIIDSTLTDDVHQPGAKAVETITGVRVERKFLKNPLPQSPEAEKPE